jgi:aryl-alcohol dehydrogenase-like predicted oxidoreductase
MTASVILGALSFGTRVGEPASFDLLDQFTDLGGRWIDTANNYSFWIDPSGLGGQSETVIGHWLDRRPGARERVLISTKSGAAPVTPGGPKDGLSAAAIQSAVKESLDRLSTDRVDLFWAHAEDRSVPLAETVAVLGELAAAGTLGELGVSNHPAWRVERARALAAAQGVAGYTAIQLRYTYLQPRPEVPLPDSGHRLVFPETLDYVASTPDLRLWAYNTLLNGGYARDDRPLAFAYDHPGRPVRLAALDAVVAETGATRNQVVLAWLLSQDIAPIVGVTTAAQITEAMAAQQLELTPAQLERLNTAN